MSIFTNQISNLSRELEEAVMLYTMRGQAVDDLT